MDTTSAIPKHLEKIYQWNSSPPSAVQDCVHNLIRTVATKYPDSQAVCAWDGTFSYQELDKQACLLAHEIFLRCEGCTGSIVPLLFEKSRWTPVAMLAVLKAGSAAIALDARHPHGRLKGIVDQASPKVILASKESSTRAAALANCPILVVERVLTHDSSSCFNLPTVSPSQLAYVTFTSGTTGIPQGACMTHSNVASAIEYQSQRLGFSRGSRVLDFAPYSFDVAWSNFFHTLCNGGCLCIAREQDMLDDLSSSIIQFDVNLLNITPTMLRTINPRPNCLKTILLSGERPYQENVRFWSENVRLVNTYGPSECTFKAAFLDVKPHQNDPGLGTGVGFATWIVDLNDDTELVAPGVPGELYLEGPQVGEGYLGSPERTASCFIENPPWLPRKGRVYKTGDLFKYDAEGGLQFMGRKTDSQHKIRGQRVEIGDVEANIKSTLSLFQPHVHFLVEVIRPLDADTSSIGVFVEAPSHRIRELGSAVENLKHKLPSVLPDFMLPNFYIPIEKMPVASTGKADRAALRELVHSKSLKELIDVQSSLLRPMEYVAPTNDIETELHRQCAAILARDPGSISMLDCFLRIGGDSIKSIQLVASSRLSGFSVSFRDVFESGNLRELALRIVPSKKLINDSAKISIPPFSLLKGHIDVDMVRHMAAKLCGVLDASVEDVLPCTALQRGMLALTTKKSDEYVSNMIYELAKETNLGCLQQAWQHIVQGTPILRTRIVDLPTQGLVQVVIRMAVPWAEYTDIDQMRFEEPMGLGTPLFRAAVVQKQCHYQFILQQHHVIYDGWSKMLILDAVEKVYSGGKAPVLLPFHNFIQQTAPEAESVSQTERYWKDQFRGCDSVLFPQRPIRPGRKFDLNHSIANIQWPSNGITPSSIIRAAIALVVSARTNTQDVVFGVTECCRNLDVAGIEQIAGPTIATVPLRVNIDRNQTLHAFQMSVQRQMIEMTPYEQVGLQNINRIVNEADSYGPFNLLLIVEPEVQGESQKEGRLFAKSRSIVFENGVPTQDLGLRAFNSYGMMVRACPGDQGLTLQINFDNNAISVDDTRRFLQQIEHVLDQLCSPSRLSSPIRHITTVTAEDLAQIQTWNEKSLPPVSKQTVVSMISAISNNTPKSIAVSSWDQSLTFSQLEIMATKFARRLNEHGCVKGSLVPICVEKSASMVIALLGVLKAGAVALPLCAATTVYRAREIVASFPLKLAVCHSQGVFVDLVQTVSDTIDSAVNNSEELQTLSETLCDSDVALILFTSGSTGRPKGISWAHSTLATNIEAAKNAFAINSSTRTFQFAAYDFDVSIIEILATISAGGCVIMPSERDRIDRLSESISEAGANWICLTPSVSETLVPSQLPCVRTIVFAGEMLRTATALRWEGRRRFNWYGPAEASMATVSAVENHDWTTGLIGRGQYSRTWLVDPTDPHKLSSIGSVAELAIEGNILAKGYVGETTEDSAFTIPRWHALGARVYLTGDLVRYTDNGNILFLRRRQDALRKVRGQRISISDIEKHSQSYLEREIPLTATAEIIGADNVMLFMAPDASSNMDMSSLKTFIKTEFPADDLERHLERLLPAYMVPRLYIPIANLPKSLTGKVDRKALREIGESLSQMELRAVQPTRRKRRAVVSATEKQLQKLWAEVLGLPAETIDATDSFLRLGGDSISAMRLVSLARHEGLELASSLILRHPYLDEMAAGLSNISAPAEMMDIAPFSLLHENTDPAKALATAARACNVPESDIEDIYPCTALQEGLLAITARNSNQYVSRSVLQVQSNIDEDQLRKAWIETVRRLPILRTRIVDVAGQGLVQVVLRNSAMRSGTNVENYVERDKAEPMGLGSELVRAAIINRFFVFTASHSIYDGAFLRILLDELEDRYLQKDEAPLTPFKNFIHYLSTCNEEAAAEFWKRQIMSSELQQFPVLPNSVHAPRANQTISRRIKVEWPVGKATPSTILRAAWALLSASYNASHHIVFGTVVTGRQAKVAGIDRCAGPTISTVPIAVSVDWNENVKHFLHRCQQQSTQITPFEQLGLQRIQKAVATRGLSTLFQTLLIVQPKPEGKNLQTDSKLFKARHFGSTIQTEGIDPFNSHALMVTCSLVDLGADITLSFDDQVLNNADADSLSAQFTSLVEQICVSSGDISVSRLQMASPDDVRYYWQHNFLLDDFTWAEAVPVLKASQDTASAGSRHFWLTEVNNPNNLAPRGAVGEIALTENVDSLTYLVPVVDPAFLSRGSGIHFPGKRGTIYRTGLLAKVNSIGNIALIGHRQDMVRVHGQMVHLGHVEKIIKESLPQIEFEVKVDLIQGTENSQDELIAFLLYQRDSDMDSLDMDDPGQILTNQSKLKLPEWALPAHYVLLPKSLVTRDGKIERELLNKHGAAQIQARIGPGALISNQVTGVSRKFTLDIETIESFTLLKGGQSVDQVREYAANLCKISEEDIEDIYPCTALQEACMALTEKRHGHFIGHSLLNLARSVDIAKFQVAWARVVSIIPALRTRIVDIPGQGLVNVVLKSSPDWSSVTDPDEYLNSPEANDMSLGRPLICYALVLNRDTGGWQFALSMHHAIYDGVTNLLLKEALEASYAGHDNVQLVPFNAFIKALSLQDKSAETAFWKAQFEGFEAPVFPALPYEGYQPRADSGFTHVVESVSWPKTDYTPATIVRAAWAYVCSKYTHSPDVCFGLVLSGRQAPVEGIERVAGPTISTMPLRVKLDYSSDIASYLEGVQLSGIEMIPYEQTGMSRISRVSPEARQACRLQTTLVIQPSKMSISDCVCFTMDAEDPRTTARNYGNFNAGSLMVGCTLDTNSIEVSFSYDSTVFSAQQIELMAGHWEQVIKQFCSLNPNTSLSDINMITEDEMDILEGWNRDRPTVVEQSSVLDYFSQSVQDQPDVAAIEAWDGAMSYEELQQASKFLSYRLISQGVRANTIVPICIERSKWMAVAYLAVVQAGGAVLMLDPREEERSLERLLQRMWPSLILCSSTTCSLGTKLVPQNVIDVTLPNSLPSTPEIKLPTVKSSDLLHIALSSGQTHDSRKLCMVEHATFIASAGQWQHLNLTRSTRLLQHPTYCDTAAHWTILSALSVGGTLIITRENQPLSEAILEHKPTTLFLPPTLIRQVRAEVLRENAHNICLWGEQVVKDDLARCCSPGINVFAAYGLPEASAALLSWKVPQDPPLNVSMSLISNSWTWVLDPDTGTRQSPFGTIGELWVGGPLVGSGYLDDVDLTKRAFFEQPARGRMFRTGDLVQQSPTDGTLTFIGKKDEYYRTIGGQRVSPLIIEDNARQSLRNLNHIPSLAVSIVIPEVTMKPTLVLFIEALDGSTLDQHISLLQQTLPERLPSHMVPSAYFITHSLPMTVSGSIDRKQLRRMGHHMTAEQLEGPRTTFNVQPVTKDSERRLQRFFATVLKVPVAMVGADSNFLRLGGDSISAMQLASLARQHGISLSVADILRTKKLSEMAKTMNSKTSTDDYVVRQFSLLQRPDKREETLRNVADQCEVGTSQVSDIYPCTGVQKSLLAVTSKRPGDYIARTSLPLKRHCDIARLKYAWDLVSRTTAPILRNRIVHTPFEGFVQVELTEPVPWSYYDTTREYLEHEQNKSMRLAEPLTRLALVGKAGNEGFSCILTQHHCNYDLVSFRLMMEELEKAYVGDVESSDAAPFQAFLEHVNRTDRGNAKEFWAQQFERCEAVPFPLLPKNEYQPQASSTLIHDIESIQWRHQEVTASTMIRTAWAILAARHADSDDVVFGALVTGRQLPIVGIERMVAPLIAAVPLRVKMLPDQTVDGLLGQIQKQAIDMIPYEQTELLTIRSINDDTRAGSYFNALVIVQPPASPAAWGAEDASPFKLTSKLRSLDGGLDNFNPHALMVMCQLHAENKISIEFSFDSGVVTRSQMESIASQFEHILRQVCSSAFLKLEDVIAISERDVRQIWQWNDSVPSPISRCIHEMFKERAQEHPHSSALCFETGHMTYAEVDYYSDRVAAHLIDLGAAPGSVIPLCFEKSPWHPIAALGSMKAGAASVSMDTTQPEGRLKLIVNQLKPNFILCSSSNEELARRISGALPVVVNHNCISTTAQLSSIPPRATPSDTLYVVFTSGSTGTPKGIVTTHQNFASAAVHQAKALNVRSGSRVYDFVSYSFDVSWSNMLNTLLSGGTLCIPTEYERKNDVVGSLNRMRADYVYFTPSVARSLDPLTMPSIRTLAMGGEPIQSSEVARWPQATCVIGIYGPAEVAQATSIVVLKPSTRNGHVGHSYGARTWLIEPGRPDRLAAIGTVGELVIEGPTVAKQYFEDPERTRTAFLEAPGWLSRGTTGHCGRQNPVYKSGDLLRYNHDGSLDFVGRKDGLVKLRGQRIELSEVEHHVRAQLQDPGACDGLVAEIITPRHRNAPILAVFIAMKKAAVPETKQDMLRRLSRLLVGLEERLAQVVPQYMVPAAWIPVDLIPITTTNKIDRRALRGIGSMQVLESMAEVRARESDRSLPSTETEQRLQALWATILNLEAENISADSSFLRIGGESISAMRLVAAARQEGLSFTVADVFRNPKLNQLAKVVKPIRDKHAGYATRDPLKLLGMENPATFVRDTLQPLLAQDLGEVEDVLPATDFQKMAVSEALQDPPGRWPHWIFDLPRDVDFSRLESACQALVARFDILRSAFVLEGDQLWSIVLRRFTAEFKVFKASGDVAAFTNELCAEDLARPRQLGSPFLRFMAIEDSSGQQHKFILRISHALFDGSSFDSVLETLSKLYRSEQVTQAVQFADVVAFNHQKRIESLKYWKMQLTGSSYPDWSRHESKLSKDALDPSKRLDFEIKMPMPKANKIKGVPTATLFHAACALVLAEEYEQEDIIIGRLVTGRASLPPHLIDAVGPTLSEVPMRIAVDENDTISSIAPRLHSQFIEEHAHESAGMYEIIRQTDWPAESNDFGWRTAYQPEETEGDSQFLGSPSSLTFYERDALPRTRSEIYATPRGGKLVLSFEGNEELIDESRARDILLQIKTVLRMC